MANLTYSASTGATKMAKLRQWSGSQIDFVINNIIPQILSSFHVKFKLKKGGYFSILLKVSVQIRLDRRLPPAGWGGKSGPRRARQRRQHGAYSCRTGWSLRSGGINSETVDRRRSAQPPRLLSADEGCYSRADRKCSIPAWTWRRSHYNWPDPRNVRARWGICIFNFCNHGRIFFE